MIMTFLKASNYRNIDGIEVEFNPMCSYIIGENNLGKSNLLSLLTTVCNGRSFDEQDFYDVEQPIEIDLDLKLCSNEQGYFADNFSPDDSSKIRILYKQKITDAYPVIISADSNESIQPRQMKKINFISYETTAIPSKELRLDTRKGTGLLISSIIENYNKGTEKEFLNVEHVEGLKEFINEYLNKIHGFRDYSIKATVAKNTTEMLASLFYLSDGDRKIETTGSGIQYIAMASINVINQIMELYKSKTVAFDDRVYTNDSGDKLLPLVLSIDEPEVHLHPFLQRSLISYYKRILQNKDKDFLELLKECFNIDGIDGQLIIVTHSTDALDGDYRNLIRFYSNENKTSVISGYSLQPGEGKDSDDCIKSENEKHLLMHFPEMKEAFYSKCAILIEGATEYGCIRSFAEKLEISLDDSGISVIDASGEGSIKPIRNLLKKFHIPSISIYDGDVRSGHSESQEEFFTTELCFEIEIVKELYHAGKQALVRQIVDDMDSKANSELLDVDFVRKPFNKLKLDIKEYEPKKLADISNDNENEFCNMFSSWFMVKKGIILGRIIGNTLPAENIPTCYKEAIEKAKEVAIGA